MCQRDLEYFFDQSNLQLLSLKTQQAFYVHQLPLDATIHKILYPTQVRVKDLDLPV